MPESDYGDFDDDDLIAATDLAQAQAQAQAAGAVAPQFALSPRPAKRQKTSSHGQQAKFRPPTAAAAARPAGTAHHPKLVSNIIGNGQKRGSVSAKWQDGNARPSIAAPRPPSDSEEDAFEPASSPPAVTRPSATTLKPSFGNGKAGANSHAGQENIDPTSAASTTQQNHTGVGRSLPKPARPVDHIEVSSDSDDGFGPPVRPVTTTHPATGGGAVRHPIVNGQQQQPVEFDIAKELEDLPSDAFSSSADEGEPNNAQWNPSAAASRPTVTYRGPQNGLRQTTLFGSKGLVGSQANKQYQFEVPVQDEPPTHHKLNREAMKTWVYPINLGSIRDYQFNIVQRGLFQNTLVALPTGLGKTFIAATIMLNWFRWTSDAQILFVAPTKPLVSQQVQACFGIAGIPRSQTTLLTGETGPGLRAEEWASKRVFFMTPQTVINDLKTGTCDPKRIVLVVVDEAHKATGAYAYVEIVKFIRRFNESFRVLALTATPGSDVESVQAIIDNLDIARVEIRTEQSLDIRQYVHGRQVEKFVFENSEEMEMCMDLYSKAVQPLLSKLNGMNAYWSKNPLSLTPYGCNQASRKWASSEAGRKAPFPVKSMVTGIFSVLASLSHSMDLLKFHGMTPFYQGLIGFRNDASAGGYGTKYRQQIVQSEHFDKLMVRLKAWCNSDEFVGHPKLEFLREIVMNHFLDAGDGREGQPPSSTRIMIFAHWRDSAEEIVRILKRSEPMIRPHVFVGQAASKNSEGMDQKRQLDVIQKFKTGVYNTIVATSIGEEGLDIGEVDMIICYDSKASPIRMLQRMGRTGRKRAGKIVLLQMKGKEEEDAAKAKDNYERMQEIIASGTQFTFHQDRNRRMIPKDIHPVVDKCEVDIPLENSQPELPEPKKRPGRQPKRPPKKFHMPDGVDTGFTTASRMNGTHDGQTTQPKAQLRIPKLFEELTTEITEDTATIPPLEDVILNDKQQRDLNNRFLNIADGDNQEIAYPNVNAYPSHQRHLSKTFAFGKPGKASAEFVSLMNRMHNIRYDPTEKWNRENKIAELETTFDQEQDKWQAILPSDDLIVQSDNENVPMTLHEANNDDAVLSDHSFSSLSSLGLPTSKPTTTLRGRGRGRPRGVAARGRTDTNTTRTLSPGPTAVEPTTPPVRGRGRGRGRGQGQTRGRGRGRGRGAGLSASAFIADGFVAEGHSSSPPGTDPLMRIRTQGIDLGSQDTDGWGEEEDEQLDSELAGFIVGDEEDVEEGGEEDDDDDDEVLGDADGTRHVSSGLGLGFSSSFSVVDRGRARGKGGLVRGRNGGAMEIDEDEEDEANEQAAGDGYGTVYDSDSGESLPEVAAIISHAAKKKRPTAISDEEEDDDLHAPRQRGAGGAAASRRRVISDDEDEDDLDLSDDE